MATDDRTADMALLPSEREMPAEAWAEYGGLPPVLRGYCWLLMRQEGDARLRLREAEMEAAEWRDRASRLLPRTEAAEAEVERLRVLGPDTEARLTDEARRIAAERDEAAATAGAAAAIARTAEAEVDRLRVELAQACADRALLAGLWLATVPPDVLPALLPADPADRERLTAALDAVDLQASEAAHIAAGRAVIARIVAEMGGTAP